MAEAVIQAARAAAGNSWGAPSVDKEAARRAGRDVKAVHGDVQVLLDQQLLAKAEDGRIECPYDEIHLDVVLKPLEADAA